jgi:hypothetical protein
MERGLQVIQKDEVISLFDLKNDPFETHNQQDNAALRALMTERLARAMLASDDTSPKPVRF